MPYEQTALKIYGDSTNNATVPRFNTYYYMPICKLNFASAMIDESPSTIRFRIEMFNGQLNQRVVPIFVGQLLGIGNTGINPHRVTVVKYQWLQLVNPDLSTSFTIISNDTSQSYTERFFWFKINCSSPENAAQVLNEIKFKPNPLLSRLKLRLFLPLSDFSENRELPIIMEHIIGGEFMAQLIQRFPNVNRTVLLGPDRPDIFRYDQIMSQSRQAIIGRFSDQDKFALTSDSEIQLQELLTAILLDQQFRVVNDVTPGDRRYDFDYLYWEEEKFRPDLVAANLNLIYDNLNGTLMKETLSNAFRSAESSRTVPDYLNVPGLFELQQLIEERPPSLKILEEFFWKIERIVNWRIVAGVGRFTVKWFNVTEINLPRILNPATYKGLKVNATFRAVLTNPIYIDPINTDTTNVTSLVNKAQLKEDQNKGQITI